MLNAPLNNLPGCYGLMNRNLNRLQNDQHNRMQGNLTTVDTFLDVRDIGDIHQDKDVGDVGDASFEEDDNDNYKSKKSDIRTVDFEPLLSDMLNRPVVFDDCVWVDPVIVNETSGWIMAFDSEPKSHPLLIKDAVQEVVQKTQLASDLSCQRKNPRGRPRKRTKNLCEYLVTSPSSSQSCKEALNTWNTEKTLGISAIDEKAVLSGLRKSKTLMILDGKSE